VGLELGLVSWQVAIRGRPGKRDSLSSQPGRSRSSPLGAVLVDFTHSKQVVYEHTPCRDRLRR